MERVHTTPRQATPAMTAEAGDLATLLGAEITAVEPLRWGFAHHTDLVSLADGRRVVVKRFEGPDGPAELRRAVSFAERLVAAGIPTPAVVAARADRDPPTLVLAHVEGTAGAEWLDSDERARTLARTMGGLAMRIRDLPFDRAAPPADGPWSDGGHLAVAATAWLEAVRDRIAPAVAERLARAIATLVDAYDDVETRIAHGDLVPVNVLLDPAGRLAGVLDLGAWRIAHPWLDVAWWDWVVRTFHREAWSASWPTMLASAGVPRGEAADTLLDGLQVIRCLEWAATRDDPAAPPLLAAAIASRIER